ncbi:hypothetical protein EAX61_00845 [Dokdonia sinensis]|uniref:VWA domain-containing protein n=1 Tax=Dokdonia sinensis TaxID=2479847 RepID=A0A3M0GFU7_9FLAO|nr:hypothetical protein [Dokdonia sinensis]RMB63961.1 hypothetical protein EAX61_00845 [Dokdonia sinensis]
MKNLLKLCAIVLLTLQASAQTEQEIKSTMITIEGLITHAATNYPTQEKQKLFLLIEASENGIYTDARFYLEQGLSLLLKRLKPDDLIALGTYGSRNEVLLPYTKIKNEKKIMEMVQVLSQPIRNTEVKDGIDQAFNLAQTQYEPGALNSVIMMRNDNIESMVTSKSKSSLQGNAESNDKTGRVSNNPKIGGAIALTALSILPEILTIIKN